MLMHTYLTYLTYLLYLLTLLTLPATKPMLLAQVGALNKQEASGVVLVVCHL